MGALQFISSLVSSLSWPVMVLLIVLVLRRPIKDMLTGSRSDRWIKAFEAGPSGVKIQYELERVAAELHAESEPPNLQPLAPSQSGGIPEPLYRVSPTAAILESFARLEQEMRRALTRAGDDILPRQVTHVADRLVTHGIWTDQERAAFYSLMRIRSYAAHRSASDEEPTPSLAETFTKVAGRLTRDLVQGADG